jgi:hypothetical protein
MLMIEHQKLFILLVMLTMLQWMLLARLPIIRHRAFSNGGGGGGGGGGVVQCLCLGKALLLDNG